jgi:predicted nucleotidyltransferase
MKTIPRGLLEEITRRLVVELQPEEVILFGSHAWGKPHQDSDLDLLVILSESKLKPTQRATQAYRALRGLFVPVDVLVKTRAEFDRFRLVTAALERVIAEKGKVLYGRRETPVSPELAR